MSTRDAARVLGCNVRTVRRAIERGHLPAAKRGSAYWIAVDDLMRYAAVGLRAPPAAPARLSALPAIHHLPTLPEPRSSFVGRDAELAGALALLTAPAVRILTLTGPGGIGKTRLAQALAAAARSHFPDGVAFISLANTSRPELVIPAICQELGLRESERHDWRTRLLAYLNGKRILLGLDNLEHLLDATPDLTQILSHAPRMTLLATSRAPLRVAGEHEFPVAPLSLPALALAPTAIDLLAFDATRLFVERAKERDPGFAVDVESAPLIADICARLEGLPLSIELAAAWIKTLPPAVLVARLDRRLPLLTSGARDAPARHRTMRNTIAWSYDLLLPEEQRLLRRLAVFAGGFPLEAAEYVGGEGGGGGAGFASGGVAALREERGEELPDAAQGVDDVPSHPLHLLGAASPPPLPSVLDIVDSLVDQSLLVREAGLAGEARFRLLETIREYGLERLGPEEEAAARTAHASYYAEVASALRPLANTQATRDPYQRLAADDANLRAALGWLEGHGPAARFVGMVAACWVYWYATGQLPEAESWLERAMATRHAATPADRARLAICAAEWLMVTGASEQAEAAFSEGLPLVREAGDPFDLAMALKSRGALANVRGAFAAAEGYLAEALKVAAEIGDPRLRAAVSCGVLGNLSVTAREQGQSERAASLIEEEQRQCAGLGLDLLGTRSLVDLADIAKARGDYRLMAARYMESLRQSGERGESRQIAEALDGIAIAAAAWGQLSAALLLFSAAAAVRERAGISMILPGDAATNERHLRILRETLGDDRFAAGWAEGQALSVPAAITLAAMVAPAPVGPDASAPALTRREREVLRLLAEGFTDREIAETLFIGRRTVSWHVSTILGKLAAASRQEAVARARADGLL